MKGDFYPFNQYIDDLSKTLDGTYKIYPSKYLITPIAPDPVSDFLTGVNVQMTNKSYKNKRNYSINYIIESLTNQEISPSSPANYFLGSDINFIGSDVHEGQTYFETYLQIPQPSQMVAYSATQAYKKTFQNQLIFAYEPLTNIDYSSSEYQSDTWDPDKIFFYEWDPFFIRYPQLYAYTREWNENDQAWGELVPVATTFDEETQNSVPAPIWIPEWKTVKSVNIITLYTLINTSIIPPEEYVDFQEPLGDIQDPNWDYGGRFNILGTGGYIEKNSGFLAQFVFKYQFVYDDNTTSEWKVTKDFKINDDSAYFINHIYVHQTSGDWSYDVAPEPSGDLISSRVVNLSDPSKPYLYFSFEDSVQIAQWSRARNFDDSYVVAPIDPEVDFEFWTFLTNYHETPPEVQNASTGLGDSTQYSSVDGWVPPASWGNWIKGPYVYNQYTYKNMWIFGRYKYNNGPWKYIMNPDGTPWVTGMGVTADVNIKVGQAKPNSTESIQNSYVNSDLQNIVRLDKSKYPGAIIEITNAASSLNGIDYSSRFFSPFDHVHRMVNGKQKYAIFLKTSDQSVMDNPVTVPTRQSEGSYILEGWTQEIAGPSYDLISWPTPENKWLWSILYDIDDNNYIIGDFPKLISECKPTSTIGSDLDASQSVFSDTGITAGSTFNVPAIVLFYNLYLASGEVVCRDMPLGIYVLDSEQTVSSGESWSTRIATKFAWAGSSVSSIVTSGNTFNTLQRVLEGMGEAIEKMNQIIDTAETDINSIKSYLDTIRRSGSINVPYLEGDNWYVNGLPAKINT